MEIKLSPIGIIHSPNKKNVGTPIQPKAAKGIKGKVEIYKKYEKGLKDLEKFSYIILLYYFDRSKDYKLMVKPYMDDNYRGLFATRAPARPNNIGLSIVKLNSIDSNILYIENVDILNKTPLLDIKPYVRDFDIFEDAKVGWLEENMHKLKDKKDDGRFKK